MSDEKVCTACIFCIHRDYGYSNWTVEGTRGACLFGLVPEFESTDDQYASAEEKKQLQTMRDVARECPHFVAGTGLYYDCDGEFETGNRTAWIGQYIKAEAK